MKHFSHPPDPGPRSWFRVGAGVVLFGATVFGNLASTPELQIVFVLIAVSLAMNGLAELVPTNRTDLAAPMRMGSLALSFLGMLVTLLFLLGVRV